MSEDIEVESKSDKAKATIELMKEYDRKMSKLVESIDKAAIDSKIEEVKELNEKRNEVQDEIDDMVRVRLNALMPRKTTTIANSMTIKNHDNYGKDVFQYGKRRTMDLRHIAKNLSSVKESHFNGDEDRWDEFCDLRDALQKMNFDVWTSGTYRAGKIYTKLDIGEEQRRLQGFTPRMVKNFGEVQAVRNISTDTRNPHSMSVDHAENDLEEYGKYLSVRMDLSKDRDEWSEDVIAYFLAYQDVFMGILDNLVEKSEKDLEVRKEVKEEVKDAGEQYAFADSLAL